jgi:excisionase family DNA binding protein
LDQQLYTLEEAQAITRLGRSTLAEKVRTGELKSVRIGRCRRIPRIAIDEFVANLISEQVPA